VKSGGILDEAYDRLGLPRRHTSSELSAAFLFGQLEQIVAIKRDRMATWNLYDAASTRFTVAGYAPE
jgi:hypothetical protein